MLFHNYYEIVRRGVSHCEDIQSRICNPMLDPCDPLTHIPFTDKTGYQNVIYEMCMTQVITITEKANIKNKTYCW